MAKRERITSLELLALLVFMQPRIPEASWAARVHCQHTSHFSSTNIPKSFSTELLSIHYFIPQSILRLGIAPSQVGDVPFGLAEVQ